MLDIAAVLRVVLRERRVGSAPWVGHLAVASICVVLAFLLVIALWAIAVHLVGNLGLGENDAPSVVQVLLGGLTLAPILWGAHRFPRLLKDQRKAKHYQAWQAINSARGTPGDGGRRLALEDLNADHVSLEGVDVSGSAHLPGLKLPRATLVRANLPGAILKQADLRDADLTEANLEGADLEMATLRGATLYRAVLRGADLGAADLDGAMLQESTLAEANLISAKLRRAVLLGANLTASRLDFANLERAHLVEADLHRADLRGAILRGARLDSVKNLTTAQLLSARDWRGARLPKIHEYLELSIDAPSEQMDRLGRTSTSAP